MTCASILLAAIAGAAAVSGKVLEKRLVNQQVFNEISLFQEYAAASYCQPNNDSPSSEIVCPNGGCPAVETAATETVVEFENSLLTDVTGFVVTDSTNELVVVSFRGSQSIRNFIADAIAVKDETDICQGCEAHAGFWRSWLEAREQVLAAVETAAAANPTFGVRVVGHSLGGAIAAFCAAQLRNDGFAADLYTFASPRFGDQALNDFITNQNAGLNVRVTHLDDPVVRLPPRFLGYAHLAPEFYISTGNDVAPGVADITRFEDAENEEGAGGDNGFSADAHSFYFNEISACNVQGFEFKV